MKHLFRLILLTNAISEPKIHANLAKYERIIRDNLINSHIPEANTNLKIKVQQIRQDTQEAQKVLDIFKKNLKTYNQEIHNITEDLGQLSCYLKLLKTQKLKTKVILKNINHTDSIDFLEEIETQVKLLSQNTDILKTEFKLVYKELWQKKNTLETVIHPPTPILTEEDRSEPNPQPTRLSLVKRVLQMIKRSGRISPGRE
jgi:hypothetical protein